MEVESKKLFSGCRYTTYTKVLFFSSLARLYSHFRSLYTRFAFGKLATPAQRTHAVQCNALTSTALEGKKKGNSIVFCSISRLDATTTLTTCLLLQITEYHAPQILNHSFLPTFILIFLPI